MAEQQPDLAALRFLQLVESLNMQAMVGMGKLADPLTGKVEKELERARATIDLLEALETKTKGNLSEDESRYLGQVLTGLRLNYVDEVESVKKEAASGAEEDSAAPEERKEEKSEGETMTNGGEEADPSQGK